MRKRINIPSTLPYPPVYQLILLLRNRKEIRHMCGPTSLAIRVMLLYEMAKKGHLAIDHTGCVVCKAVPYNDIYKAIYYKVAECRFPPDALLKCLNGEKSKDLGVTGLRKTIYKDMESKRIIHVKKSVVYTKIVIEDIEMWRSVFSAVVAECKSGKPSTETLAILLAINFVNRMESILLQCNQTDSEQIVSLVSEFKNRVVNKVYDDENRLIFEILRPLAK